MPSSPVVVTVSHTLGREQALQRIQDGIAQFRQMKTPILIEQEQWSGYRLDFRLRALGHSCFGSIDVLSDSVRLEVALTGILGFAARSALLVAKKRAQTLLRVT